MAVFALDCVLFFGIVMAFGLTCLRRKEGEDVGENKLSENGRNLLPQMSNKS